ncbi:MAG: hypothetical protein Q9186_004661 [Xanthomendoza sp. 1 TL-2023]
MPRLNRDESTENGICHISNASRSSIAPAARLINVGQCFQSSHLRSKKAEPAAPGSDSGAVHIANGDDEDHVRPTQSLRNVLQLETGFRLGGRAILEVESR